MPIITTEWEHSLENLHNILLCFAHYDVTVVKILQVMNNMQNYLTPNQKKNNNNNNKNTTWYELGEHT